MTAERADFGARLRAAREARGLSIAAVAAKTKISVQALEALERNDISRLPGGIFTRSFVRAYAQEVGLNPDKTVQEFNERFSSTGDAAPPQEVPRVRISAGDIDDGGRSHGGLRWLGLAVTVILVAVWIGVDRYYTNRTENAGAPPQTSTTDTPRPPAPPPLPTTQPAPVPSPGSTPGTESQQAAGQPPTPAAPSSASASETPRATAGEPAAVPANPSQPPQPPVSAAPGSTQPAPAVNPALPLQVVLAPQAACWVTVNVDGKRVAGRTLQPGEKLELSAAQAITVVAGDAGALTYTVNKVPGRALGTSGQVAKVTITTTNFQTFQAGRQ